MLLPGSSSFTLMVLAVAGVVGIALGLPFVIATCWAIEIEKVLADRGLAPPHAQSMETRVGMVAMKVVLWATILVLAFYFPLTNVI